MLKIFLTGDAHIGLKYARRRKGAYLEEVRLKAFEPMVEQANNEGCGLFVISGDMFEDGFQCTRAEVKELVSMLSKFRGTVAILPGNHDYYTAESPLWQYLSELTAGNGNIMPLVETRPYILNVGGDRVILYPAPCMSLHSSENNIGWIKSQEIDPAAGYHIGIAHGTLKGESMDSEEVYFPMTREELNAIPVDAWLLGHVHVPYPRNLTVDSYARGETIFNAGTHVQPHHACNTEGCAFIIQIDEQKNVSAKKCITGPIRFFSKEVKAGAGTLKGKLNQALVDIPDNSVVDVSLLGAVTADEYDRRAEIIEPMLSRFIEADYSDFSLSKLLSQEMIDKTFPETSFQAKLLKTLMADPKEAQLAFELLTTLK